MRAVRDNVGRADLGKLRFKNAVPLRSVNPLQKKEWPKFRSKIFGEALRAPAHNLLELRSGAPCPGAVTQVWGRGNYPNHMPNFLILMLSGEKCPKLTGKFSSVCVYCVCMQVTAFSQLRLLIKKASFTLLTLITLYLSFVSIIKMNWKFVTFNR